MAYRRREDKLSDILTPEQVKELINLYKQGQSVRAIAENFNVHRNTVTNVLNRARRKGLL